MEEQEASGAKPESSDLPDGLEAVSPESDNGELSTNKEIDVSNSIDVDLQSNVDKRVATDTAEDATEEQTESDKAQEESADNEEKKEDQVESSRENETVLENNVDFVDSVNKEAQSSECDVTDSENKISDDVSRNISDMEKNVSSDVEEPMDVDTEGAVEVKQNGPEECHDERDIHQDENDVLKKVSSLIEEDEKMDVDDQVPTSQDKITHEEDDKDEVDATNKDSDKVGELETCEKDSKKLDKSKDNEELGSTSKSKQSEVTDIEEGEVIDKDKRKSIDDDTRENPEFESAPEVAEISQNDTQGLDPFDELLKEDSSKAAVSKSSKKKSQRLKSKGNQDTLDDDMDTSTVNDLTETIDDTLVDDANLADVTEGQGADEEVCLLPDTEREISEADKLKALAAKKTDAETTTTTPFDSLVSGSEDKSGEDVTMTVMKGEINTDENGEHVDSSTNELNSLHEDIDLGEDDSLRESGDMEQEKEKEVEAEMTETLNDNIIQEITETEQKCLQCSETKQCKYRLVIDNETKYICSNDCTKEFQEANPNKYTISIRKVFIKEVLSALRSCIQCKNVKSNFYKITNDDEQFICGEECLKAFVGDEKDKYIITRKRKFLHEIDEKEGTCIECLETKMCLYELQIEEVLKYICSPLCVSSLQRSQPGIYRVKKKKVVKVKPPAPLLKLKVISNATDKYLGEGNKMIAKTPEQVAAARADRDRSFFRMCAQCQAPYLGNDKNLTWETMDFCNEGCLGKYQNIHGSHCANCKNEVSITSLGKYCVRFGYDIRQFCCSGCLEEFKKGLKICCYCQRDISTGFEGFLAPVGDKGQFKDFCSQFCVEKFDQMSRNPVPPPVWARCAVCSKEKPTQLEVAIDNKNSLRLCSEPCFAAFKFVNHIFPDQCRWCNKYFERKSSESYTIYTEAATHCFCSKACMNVYISNSRHIVPCNWCKVKKYNFDMIKRTLDNGQTMMMCSLNCLTLYQVSVTAVSSRRIKCDQCKRTSQAQYHLTMSDATVRNFCTYQCVMSFQGQYSKAPLIVEGDNAAAKQQAVPTGAPRRTLNSQRNNTKTMKIIDSRASGGMPVIASVQSLASVPPKAPPPPQLPQVSLAKGRAKRGVKQLPLAALVPPIPERVPTPPPVEPPKPPTPPPPPPPKIFNHVIIKPVPPKEVKNVSTLTKPIMVTKGITCKPHMATKEVQTEDHLQRRILIPIPVPIYVPSPVSMYSLPFPVPVPIPMPIPIPIFIPTTRNTANGIMKEIKKIHEKMPTDPFEAELLMMAEMVAGEKKKAESDSDSEEEPPADDGFSPDAMDTGNSAFGEDVLQMALKMATEYEEPPVDLESAMTASTITPGSHPIGALDDNSPLHHHQMMLLEQQQRAAAAAAAVGVGRKRGRGSLPPASPAPAPPTPRAKRSRRNEPPPPPQPPQPEPVREPQEKPDANMCLKYTFGVNAWKQWVVTKNQEMEKSTVRRKPFKSEILQLTADELNYSLCLFVKEVRKPNGSEYAPDTIYYLVLGIQQYLFENGRIDNIFTDSYYEKFTECLDEVARKFSVLYNDSQYIVTRVEEEHLWECKQLGAHSPHVLLSTLMFFNTKHFNLVTPEEHMQLSFSHIMKHWKRNPNQPGAAKIPGSRNVLLRFYPPQSALEANSRKKKVYEQQENEENPLRCPVKLYEFYLSKCPESVKTRNDVFYLMPERSCVPDSPVWYSTQALGKEPLSKMLHRVKMVKEINIALLTS